MGWAGGGLSGGLCWEKQNEKEGRLLLKKDWGVAGFNGKKAIDRPIAIKSDPSLRDTPQPH